MPSSKIASGTAETNTHPEPTATPTQDAEAIADDTKRIDVQRATVLAPTSIEARQPADWLNHALANITAGPVVVPPLSDVVLQRWAATTPRPSKFLPVHPWLYGLLPDAEGTPLVGIAFRLELDILQHCRELDEDDGGSDCTW